MGRPLHAFVLALLLAGCAAAPPKPVDPQGLWEQRSPSLAQLSHWRVTGRLAILNSEESWHATLDWRQQGGRYDIRLIAPLGQGTVRLYGEPQWVVMQTSDGASRVASDPDTLLAEHLGWPLPIAGLRYWVRGLADPGAEAVPQLDEAGRLYRLDQQGWQIQYRGYRSVGTLELPAKIFMDSSEFKVRLVLDDWRMPGDG